MSKVISSQQLAHLHNYPGTMSRSQVCSSTCQPIGGHTVRYMQCVFKLACHVCKWLLLWVLYVQNLWVLLFPEAPHRPDKELLIWFSTYKSELFIWTVHRPTLMVLDQHRPQEELLLRHVVTGVLRSTPFTYELGLFLPQEHESLDSLINTPHATHLYKLNEFCVVDACFKLIH